MPPATRPSYGHIEVTPRVRALRATFRTMGAVAPGLAARLAEEIFCRPPRALPRAHEEAFLARGTRFTVDAGPWPLAAWRWGTGPRTVVLLHGWGSRAARFHALVDALVAAGFSCVAFDGPAHGRTPGRRASMPEFAQALRAVVAQVGPVHAAVGHSMGGAVIAMALHDALPIGRAVLLAPPADPEQFSHLFARLLHIPERARRRMEANLERRFRIRWRDLHIPTLVRGHAVPALVVHDTDDIDVAWAEGRAIAEAWPGATLMTTSGLGHRAVLRDPAVVARVVQFLAA